MAKFKIYFGTGTSGYAWTVEELVENEGIYVEALTSGVYDTRRDVTAESEASITQIIAGMKVAFPTSDTYYRHNHHHNNSSTCEQVAV